MTCTLFWNISLFAAGIEHLNIAQDSSNSLLSQFRIHIQMASGRIVAKFRILHGTIQGSLDSVSIHLIACIWPHNFIIHKEVVCDINYNTGTEEIDAPNEKTFWREPFACGAKWWIWSSVGMSYIQEVIVEHLCNYDNLRPSFKSKGEKDRWDKMSWNVQMVSKMRVNISLHIEM